MDGTVDGLAAGQHGLAVHEYGDISDGEGPCEASIHRVRVCIVVPDRTERRLILWYSHGHRLP